MDSLKCLSAECVNLLHKNRLLQPLIKSELKSSLLSEVAIDKELEISATNELKNKLKINNEDEFEKFLVKNGLDNKQFNNLALVPLRSKKYSLEKFGNKSEARFLERKNQLDIVVYSLIRVSNSSLCRELYLKIYEKESDFGELASQYSEGIEKRTRGIVGPIPLEKTHPFLAEHLRTSKIGEVSPPFRLNKSTLITRVESYEPVQLDNYMKDKMSEELFELWLNEKSISILNKLIMPSESNIESLGEIL